MVNSRISSSGYCSMLEQEAPNESSFSSMKIYNFIDRCITNITAQKTRCLEGKYIKTKLENEKIRNRLNKIKNKITHLAESENRHKNSLVGIEGKYYTHLYTLLPEFLRIYPSPSIEEPIQEYILNIVRRILEEYIESKDFTNDSEMYVKYILDSTDATDEFNRLYYIIHDFLLTNEIDSFMERFNTWYSYMLEYNLMNHPRYIKYVSQILNERAFLNDTSFASLKVDLNAFMTRLNLENPLLYNEVHLQNPDTLFNLNGNGESVIDTAIETVMKYRYILRTYFENSKYNKSHRLTNEEIKNIAIVADYLTAIRSCIKDVHTNIDPNYLFIDAQYLTQKKIYSSFVVEEPTNPRSILYSACVDNNELMNYVMDASILEKTKYVERRGDNLERLMFKLNISSIDENECFRNSECSPSRAYSRCPNRRIISCTMAEKLCILSIILLIVLLVLVSFFGIRKVIA
ncbi:hypothetical protein NEPAR06_0763 [Nematocida parisii]|uniref:Uncharacterized protein n=1 Tax=Nematocida parisii (strain ERTm3) TaxID=935791 RepID=I3EJ67_NEMP3|nr:uncharacterized protein NEPG_02502 [Nematocida parisii ERTm1]EIJ89264.1 hypothetical protein NEQG_00034 [Nematocida parisii ERTm3]KAI5143628.1 hypothetical protein NEPAR07_0728 [Nematocida parisii]EIJ92614.1 hypothetical protein NEPG_02502 [Nematocida parisii ERTm1]KAI5153975.1 hypothetical protein NEPAR06_0763 [Nematocida parisii]KAI5155918.1 hypothetical protein NEPAR05_0167 [Nematocida parisii]|eukprot:XP_013060329.1 hypothetical protein NEPG_02502 [Nematocida parisii ERTm1]